MRAFLQIVAAIVVVFAVALLVSVIEVVGLVTSNPNAVQGIETLDASVLVTPFGLGARLVGFFLALLAIRFLAKAFFKLPPSAFGVTWDGIVRDNLLGFGLGALLMTLIVGVLWVAGWYVVDGVSVVVGAVLFGLAYHIAVSLFEEALFRGILFAVTERHAGTWVALALTGAIFGLAHAANPGASVLSTLGIALGAGLLLGMTFVVARNLWLPVGVHAAWNWVQGYVFGVPVSGIVTDGILDSRLVGPALWTGGGFGVEAGLVALAVVLGASAALVGWAYRNGEMIPFGGVPAPEA